jgi:TatA/E family protein of Tat protein translocase
MPSLTHLGLVAVIGVLLFGPKRIPRTIGAAVREFKKGLRGEGDIDVTDTVKHLDHDER